MSRQSPVPRGARPRPARPIRSAAVTIALTAAAGISTGHAAAGSCARVDTVVHGTVASNGENSADIHGGPIKGTINARFTTVGPSPDGLVIESTGTIATKRGSISVESSGVLELNDPLAIFHATGIVTGGTAKFAHATGDLTFSGTADLGAGTFTEYITGEICR
jgi:hypothetical protein